MAWDATQPPNAGALLSAPIRGNFVALDSTLMSPFPGWGTNALIYKSSSTALGAIAAVAAGQVLTSTGTGTAPAWTATPSFGSLQLTTGGLRYPEIAAPATPAANTVITYAKTDGRMYLKDDAGTERLLGVPALVDGQLLFGNVSGEIAQTAQLAWSNATKQLAVSGNGGVTGLYTEGQAGAVLDLNATGGHRILFFAGGTGSAWPGGVGGWGVHDAGDGVAAFYYQPGGHFYLRCIGHAGPRYVAQGAPDSGGAGYRMLTIQNA